MKAAQRNFILYLLILHLSVKGAESNVLFRFNFDFGIDLSKTSLNASLHTGEKSNEYTESMSKAFTTTAPILEDIWLQQAKLNASANDKLQSTRIAVTEMKKELSDYVGHSDFIAAKVKIMTQYLRRMNGNLENGDTAVNRFLILQEYVQLVDQLREPQSGEQDGELSLDYAIVKMALEKHRLLELQTQILVEVLQAMETWQKYTQTQLLDLVTV